MHTQTYAEAVECACDLEVEERKIRNNNRPCLPLSLSIDLHQFIREQHLQQQLALQLVERFVISPTHAGELQMFSPLKHVSAFPYATISS
jgi:hypothetical protein